MHADNAALFRHMKRCSGRQVVSDDGRGRRVLRVAHEGRWRFLLFRGSFTTRRVLCCAVLCGQLVFAAPSLCSS